MDYQKQAQDILDRGGITFAVALVGNDCPMWCEDARKQHDMDKLDTFPRNSHIHGKHYRCTLTRDGQTPMIVDFWNSYADEEYNFAVLHRDCLAMRDNLKITLRSHKKQPVPYDVLACLTKGDPGTFEDFCADFGYDTDSRRAEDTYKAVQREWRNVQRFFTSEEVEALAEVN